LKDSENVTSFSIRFLEFVLRKAFVSRDAPRIAGDPDSRDNSPGACIELFFFARHDSRSDIVRMNVSQQNEEKRERLSTVVLFFLNRESREQLVNPVISLAA
jgi:hypothetical protein